MDLVVKNKKGLFCTSYMVAEKFEVEHNKVVRAIHNFMKRLDEFKVDLKSTLNLQDIPEFINVQKEYRGQIFEGYEMNKTAFEHIATKFKTQKALEWQLKFIDAFSRMEAAFTSEAYIEARRTGKLIRREETDTVQEFIKYATAQGSKNARFYYANISNMENKALFLIDQKYDNIREILDFTQLMTVSVADRIVAKALKEGMEKQLDYKEIYQLAKRNVETLAAIQGRSVAGDSKKIAA